MVKGASSVLYGPNTMGGIVDVLSKRPETNQFTLRLDYGTRQTYGVYANGAVRGKNVLFTGSASREASDGFNWVNNGETELRKNSDYKHTNLGGKLYFYPGGNAEIMAEVNYYQAEYGIPTATAYYKQQYWRFKDWQRLMANLGGSFPLLDGGYVKARLYYVKYYNVLDAYKNDQFTVRQWESTFDNFALGAFVLGMVPLGEKNQLQGSVTYRDDDVSTQSDVNKPWEHYEHKTLSLGLEDHFRVSEKVELMAGASLDHLSQAGRREQDHPQPHPGREIQSPRIRRPAPDPVAEVALPLHEEPLQPCRRTAATPTCATRSAPTSNSASPTTGTGTSAARSSTTTSAT